VLTLDAGSVTVTSDAGASTVLLDVVGLTSHDYGSSCRTLVVELALGLVDTFAQINAGGEQL